MGQQHDTPIISTHDEPEGVLSAYLRAAMSHAFTRDLGKRGIYTAIRGIDDVWGHGNTQQVALRDLRGALEWFVLTSIFEHRSLPAFDGVSLTIVEDDGTRRRDRYPVARPSLLNPLDGLIDDTGDTQVRH